MTLRDFLSSTVLGASTVLVASFALAGCGAPSGETVCADFCDNIELCGAGGGSGDGGCMWACLAAIEWRQSKGDRCGRKARLEFECLATVDDCEFLLDDRVYNRNDPCAPEGGSRSNACVEDGIPGDELVPLSADLENFFPED